jgi:hypothetical protein
VCSTIVKNTAAAHKRKGVFRHSAHPLQLGEDAGAPGDHARQPHQRVQVILPACVKRNALGHAHNCMTQYLEAQGSGAMQAQLLQLHAHLQLPHLRSRMLSWIGRSVMRTKTSLAISP